MLLTPDRAVTIEPDGFIVHAVVHSHEDGTATLRPAWDLSSGKSVLGRKCVRVPARQVKAFEGRIGK